MKQFNTIATGFVFSLVLLTSGLFAQNPTISIQGTLKDANGASVDDGTQSVTFRLYDALTAGNNLWEETAPVTVVGGIYSHNLGKVTPLTGGDFANTVYLGVKVGGIELSPRTEMTYAPYALSVNSAQQIAQGGCSGQVGDLKYSILPPAQFATQNGNCWVPMDGRGISGTRLASLMGITIAPDMSGLFVRATEYSGNRDPDRSLNASPPSIQSDDYKQHRHDLNLNTENDGQHRHAVLSTLNFFRDRPETPGYNVMNFGTLSPGLAYEKSSSFYLFQELQLHDNGPVPKFILGDTGIGGEHVHQIDGITQNAGNAETRPKNMNFFIYIRVD
jgi:hypothetical protein